MYTYEYPRPAVVTDVVAFTVRDETLQVLLIQRANEPHKGAWALPGGFVGIDEDLDAAALRELREETGLADVYVEQLYAFGAPQRAPGQRVIAIAYCAIVPSDRAAVQAASDAAAAHWWEVSRAPRLAFDHAAMLALAHERLRSSAQRTVVAAHFLPHEFSLDELDRVQEAVLGRGVDAGRIRQHVGRTDGFEPASPAAADAGEPRYRLASSGRRSLLCITNGELDSRASPN